MMNNMKTNHQSQVDPKVQVGTAFFSSVKNMILEKVCGQYQSMGSVTNVLVLQKKIHYHKENYLQSLKFCAIFLPKMKKISSMDKLWWLRLILHQNWHYIGSSTMSTLKHWQQSGPNYRNVKKSADGSKNYLEKKRDNQIECIC